MTVAGVAGLVLLVMDPVGGPTRTPGRVFAPLLGAVALLVGAGLVAAWIGRRRRRLARALDALVELDHTRRHRAAASDVPRIGSSAARASHLLRVRRDLDALAEIEWLAGEAGSDVDPELRRRVEAVTRQARRLRRAVRRERARQERLARQADWPHRYRRALVDVLAQLRGLVSPGRGRQEGPDGRDLSDAEAFAVLATVETAASELARGVDARDRRRRADAAAQELCRAAASRLDDREVLLVGSVLRFSVEQSGLSWATCVAGGSRRAGASTDTRRMLAGVSPGLPATHEERGRPGTPTYELVRVPALAPWHLVPDADTSLVDLARRLLAVRQESEVSVDVVDRVVDAANLLGAGHRDQARLQLDAAARRAADEWPHSGPWAGLGTEVVRAAREMHEG